MRCRFCKVMVLGVAIAGLFLGVPLAGQVPASSTTTGNVPRTPDGHPDLQGVWNYATVTPMQRPSAAAGKDVLTDAEAAEFEAQAVQRQNRDLNVPEGNVGDYNNFWYDRGTTVIKTKRTSS